MSRQKRWMRLKEGGRAIAGIPDEADSSTAAKSDGNVARFAEERIKAGTRTAGTALIAALGGGWVLILALGICVILGIAGSSFGIFFAGAGSTDGQTVRDVILEINRDFEDELAAIDSAGYDRVDTTGARANWTDVLAVYAVKTATDPDAPMEVVTVDEERKSILREIFKDMNRVSTSVETETVTTAEEIEDESGEAVTLEIITEKKILKVNIAGKTASEMSEKYSFSDDQKEQLEELLDAKNLSLWTEPCGNRKGGKGRDHLHGRGKFRKRGPGEKL